MLNVCGYATQLDFNRNSAIWTPPPPLSQSWIHPYQGRLTLHVTCTPYGYFDLLTISCETMDLSPDCIHVYFAGSTGTAWEG